MCTRFHAAPAKEVQNDYDRKGEAATMSLGVFGGTARHGIMLERQTGPSNESGWMRGPGSGGV